MELFFTVLEVLGIAAAAILSLALLAAVAVLLTRVNLRVRYAESKFEASVRIWGRKVELWPRKAREKAGKEKRKAKKEKPEKKKPDVSQYLDFVQPAIDALKRAVRSVFVSRLELTFTAASENDPAAAALQYGQAWSIVGAVVPVLENCKNVKRYSFDVKVDFDAGRPEIDFLAELTAAVWRFVIIGIIFLWNIYKTKKEKRKQK